MIYEFNGYRPVVHPSSFVHPQAAVTGNVIIGKNVYIGPGAAIRGDWGEIIIEDGCNVQENCTIHMFPGVTVTLKEAAHIGHGAIIHGATIGRNCLIGMNAVIMDNAVIGDECIVGALSFIQAEKQIPNRSLVVGNPGKIIAAQPQDMHMHNRAQPKHAARHPAQGLSGDFLDRAIFTAVTAPHTGQRIFDGNASGSNVIRRRFGIADTGLRHGWYRT